jgi:hypothetical protein
MTAADLTPDALIAHIRERLADADRRVDEPPSQLEAATATMDLGGMLGMIGDLGRDLARVVSANRSGRPLDPEIADRAERLGASITTPVASELPSPADRGALERAEAELGQALPDLLRRVYTEVADGGFGPGRGLLGVEGIATTYRELTADPPAPRGLGWPAGMIPLAHHEPGYICLELPGGRVMDWDPEATSEWQDADGWAASFQELAPDVGTWLGTWVMARTPAEQREDEMIRLRREGLRRHRETVAAMTPEEREAIGLPAEGWEAAYIDDEDV